MKIFFLLFFITINCFSQTEKEAEEFILKSISSSQDSIKLYILDNIEDIPLNSFKTEIKNLLKSKNDNVKIKSAYVLYKVYKDTHVINVIIDFVLDKPKITENMSTVAKAKVYLKNQLRAEAVKMLGELGDRNIVNVLSKTVKDDDGNVADASYFALALLSQRGVIKQTSELKEFFYEGLKDLNPKVRLQAVKFLAQLKYEDSVPPLTLRLKDTNKEVVLETIKALGKIGNKEVLKDLLQYKTSPDDAYRLTLAESLGDLASNIIISSFTDTESLTKIKNVLQGYLNDINGSVRVTAARSLFKINDRTGVEVLKKGLESNDEDIVLYSIETFGEYGDLDDVKYLSKFTNSSNELLKTASFVNILKIYYRVNKKR
jgi:HEAT repeat protein